MPTLGAKGTSRKATTRSLVSALAAILILLATPGTTALGSTSMCSLNTHCYAVLRGSGTAFYGLNGNWDRANMTTPSSISNPEFVDSEMWLKNSDTLWVEEGLAYGWEARLGAVAYYAFYAWYTPSGYDLAVIASLVPNSAVTDQYQVSSPAPDGTWNVWWDGNHYTTPATGMTSFTIPELGAEVATTNGCAQTFNMYSQAYNSAGQPGNWGAQTAYWVPVNIGGTQLNGFSYQNSEWSWNTVDTTGC